MPEGIIIVLISTPSFLNLFYVFHNKELTNNGSLALEMILRIQLHWILRTVKFENTGLK